MNVLVPTSPAPRAQPPRSNPFLRSSSDAPPFPCITPSTVTCVMVVSFMGSSSSLVEVCLVMTVPRRGSHREQRSPRMAQGAGPVVVELCNNRSVARSYVLLAALLFGTTGTAQALGPAGSSPLTVGAARVVLGGGVLGLLAFAGSRAEARMSPALVLCAGAAIAIYQLTFFEAVHRAGVAVGAVVAIGSGPVAAGVLERGFGDPWPGARWLAATVLAIAGIVALSFGGTGHAAASTSGILLALASGTAYATYTVIAKRLLYTGAGPVRVMGAGFGVGSLLLLPVLLIGDTQWLHSTRGIELAAYLAVGPTIIAYLLVARGLG